MRYLLGSLIVSESSRRFLIESGANKPEDFKIYIGGAYGTRNT